MMCTLLIGMGIELRIEYMLRSVLIKIVYFKQEFKFKFKNRIYNHALHISGKYTFSVFFFVNKG